MKNTYLAVDIGASSGRHIIGSVENNKIQLQETYRFTNGVHEVHGHLCWDMDHLRDSVIRGIKASVDAGFSPKTMGIDTWAVDFVLLDENRVILGDTVAYRDQRTNGIRDQLERDGIITFQECYSRTGIQYQKFNTIYQLLAIKKEHPEYLEHARYFLMVSDYLNYILTGVMMNEYTNASSTGLVSAESKNWDLELIRKIGLPEEIFLPIQMPGTVVGELLPDIQKETGASLQVILPATHDTGSAFLAVPARDDNAVFISSGTWSLLGVENQKAITSMESCRENFTNEGGYEYRFRYLKNIMGLWMFQNAKKEIDAKLPEGETVSFKELQDKADGYDLDVLVNVDDDRFLAPESMLLEVRKASQEQGVELPQDDEAVLNVIFRSLAADYAAAVKKLEQLTGKTYTAVNIVGGGSQNTYLNALTAKYTGLPVYAGPTEGTALGNLIVQFIHDGVFQDLSEARTAIADSFDIKEYS